MEFIISIPGPGKSWNLSEGHGKAICFRKTKRQKDEQFEKITEESATAFNFSRNRHQHVFYTL